MPYDKAHHRPDDRDEQAPEIEPRDARRSKRVKDPPANDRANDSQHDVEQHAFAAPVHDLASDESSNQPQHNPAHKVHGHDTTPKKKPTWMNAFQASHPRRLTR